MNNEEAINVVHKDMSVRESYKQCARDHKERPDIFMHPDEWLKLHVGFSSDKRVLSCLNCKNRRGVECNETNPPTVIDSSYMARNCTAYDSVIK